MTIKIRTKELKGVCFFYQKLLVPSISISALISCFKLPSMEFHIAMGFAYMLIMPAVHYFTYDMRNVNEYYFYFNLGLSKLFLWSCTLLISVLTGLVVVSI